MTIRSARGDTHMIGQKFCCSALIGLQVVGSQGQKVVLSQHQGKEKADGNDWSEILLLCSYWLNVAGGWITRPESGTTTANKERRRPTVMIGHKFCCFALIV
jgi:hypothetical protein